MSVFSRNFYGPDPTFTNLFRLLDDFDSYSRSSQGPNGRHARQQLITPKFDVRETENTYELHGELPGIERKDLKIEFTEPQTMVVAGRVERNYSAGTPPAGLVEDKTEKMSGAITEGGEETASHKATVSDEEDEAAKEKGEFTPEQTPKTEVAEPVQAPRQHPKERYWHQERSIGEFHRTFNFPARVDETGVSANLTNGILHVSVPKAAKHTARSININ